MNPELIEKLAKLGLDEGQIEKLEKQLGVTEQADLAYVEPSDLEGLGVPTVRARRIIGEAKQAGQQPATAAPQTPSFPSEIRIKTGRPADMTMRELVTALADGERDSEVITEVRRRTYNRRVFVREAGGEKIDVDSTMEVMDHSEGMQPPDFWGSVPTETLDQILERRKAANPITGQPLAKGDAWLSVSEERRLLAAYGRLSNLLTGLEDEFQLVDELKKKTLGGRWQRIQSAFDRAQKSRDSLVDQARTALFVLPRTEGRSGSMPPFGGGSNTVVGARGVNVGGHVGGSIVTGDGNRVGGNNLPAFPKTLSHAQQLALKDGLESFNITELENLADDSGVSHENLAYREVTALRRELVSYHQRHSSFDQLFAALYKRRPAVNWLAVANADEKGDVVHGTQINMPGDFRGANINIGTNITGDRRDK